MAQTVSRAQYAPASTYPTSLWVVLVREFPLIDGTIDPDRAMPATTCDVLAFPARGAADTAAARRYVAENTYVDLGRKVFRTCEMRMAEVRR